MMKRKNRTKIFVASLVSALIACATLLPQVSAYETTTAYNNNTAETTLTSSQGTESTVSEYNLASEDWDSLLGVGGATQSTGGAAVVSDGSQAQVSGWFSGNEKSDGGVSKLLIIAIIAFALGGIGIAFFIYSQFVYKAKLRRKAQVSEQVQADKLEQDYDLQSEPMQLELNSKQKPSTEKPVQKKPVDPPTAPTTSKANDFFDDFERQTSGKADTQMPKRTNSSLSEEDEKRLKQVDWDEFFNQK